MSESRLEAHLPDDVGFINLRGDPRNEEFLAGTGEALGQPLPTGANTFTDGNHRIYWLGPDEWLVCCSRESAPQLAESLAATLKGLYSAVNDVSGGNVMVRLAGPAARRLLAKGCTLDLHPREFPTGRCAQSGLAKAAVLLGMIDEAPTFEIIVRRSFSDYLIKWLRHAGHDAGIVFT